MRGGVPCWRRQPSLAWLQVHRHPTASNHTQYGYVKTHHMGSSTNKGRTTLHLVHGCEKLHVHLYCLNCGHCRGNAAFQLQCNHSVIPPNRAIRLNMSTCMTVEFLPHPGDKPWRSAAGTILSPLCVAAEHQPTFVATVQPGNTRCCASSVVAQFRLHSNDISPPPKRRRTYHVLQHAVPTRNGGIVVT